MKQPKLHFVIDPLCGWTYAAGPLMAESLSIKNLSIEVHGGGMLTGERKRQITPEWRSYVVPHDQRIAEISGQPLGTDYYDELLNDTSVVLDSTPPTIAVLIAQDMANMVSEC